jgi:hypothetical protein
MEPDQQNNPPATSPQPLPADVGPHETTTPPTARTQQNHFGPTELLMLLYPSSLRLNRRPPYRAGRP